MNLKETIKKNKRLLLKEWFTATINTYPKDSARILEKIPTDLTTPWEQSPGKVLRMFWI